MFDQTSRPLLRFVPDYKINLITPEGLSEEDLDKFHTEFRNVMKFIKYSDNKNALRNILEDDESFKSVSRDTANLINVVTKSHFKITEDEEVVDMCKAMMEIIEESKAEGIGIGREEGIGIGREEGIGIGREEGIGIGREQGIGIGREEGRGIGRQEERDFILNSLITGYQSGAIKLEFAAQLAGMSVEEFLEKTRAS